ncbi:unnamed protein product, partial [Ixodes persulcatus]
MVCCRLPLKRVSKSMLERAAMYLSVHSAFSSSLKSHCGWGTFGSILLAFISRVHPTAGHVSHNVVIRVLPAYCDTTFTKSSKETSHGANPSLGWKTAPQQQHPHRPQCPMQT